MYSEEGWASWWLVAAVISFPSPGAFLECWSTLEIESQMNLLLLVGWATLLGVGRNDDALA